MITVLKIISTTIFVLTISMSLRVSVCHRLGLGGLQPCEGVLAGFGTVCLDLISLDGSPEDAVAVLILTGGVRGIELAPRPSR